MNGSDPMTTLASIMVMTAKVSNVGEGEGGMVEAKVPAGTVGIGGEQTGIYPLMTPGGWNLIGRTPVKMFDAARAEPALLRVGDRVKFRAISAKEFVAWK